LLADATDALQQEERGGGPTAAVAAARSRLPRIHAGRSAGASSREVTLPSDQDAHDETTKDERCIENGRNQEGNEM